MSFEWEDDTALMAANDAGTSAPDGIFSWEDGFSLYDPSFDADIATGNYEPARSDLDIEADLRTGNYSVNNTGDDSPLWSANDLEDEEDPLSFSDIVDTVAKTAGAVSGNKNLLNPKARARAAQAGKRQKLVLIAGAALLAYALMKG